MKILVVDDTPMMLMSIGRILERNDHRMLSAGNGEEALGMLQNDTSIELIITDMMMPEMTGIELYQRVQTMERFNDQGPVPTPPMILMTAHPLCRSNGTVVEEFELLHSCFEAIVQKPVKEEELLVAIRKAAARAAYASPCWNWSNLPCTRKPRSRTRGRSISLTRASVTLPM